MSASSAKTSTWSVPPTTSLISQPPVSSVPSVSYPRATTYLRLVREMPSRLPVTPFASWTSSATSAVESAFASTSPNSIFVQSTESDS